MCKRSLDVYSANLFAFINVGHKNLNGCLFGTKLAEKHSDARMVEPAPKKQRRVTEFFFLKSLKGKAQNYKLAKLEDAYAYGVLVFCVGKNYKVKIKRPPARCRGLVNYNGKWRQVTAVGQG